MKKSGRSMVVWIIITNVTFRCHKYNPVSITAIGSTTPRICVRFHPDICASTKDTILIAAHSQVLTESVCKRSMIYARNINSSVTPAVTTPSRIIHGENCAVVSKIPPESAAGKNCSAICVNNGTSSESAMPIIIAR